MSASSPPPRPVESFEDLEGAGLSGLLESIDEGLPATLVDTMQKRLEIGREKMAHLLGISPRTLKRRRERGTLSPVESERLYRVEQLFRTAIQVFGREEKARSWLKRPQMRLGGEVPLEIARLEPGAREVERLLGRIEHGIPA
jgi:putative toxin-antitoxin system antitoxin component (TIGR02293 family)